MTHIYKHSVIPKTMPEEEVFENVTIYLVTFPEGAGNSFMGYLQQVYGGDSGFKPLYVDKNISWSGKFKTGITIFNLFPMDSFLHPDVEGLKPTVIAPRVSIGGNEGDPSLAKKIQDLWGISSTVWLNDHPTESRSERRKECMFRLARIIGSQAFKKYRTLNGNIGAILYSHYAPYGVEGINKYFKNVKHLLAVNPGDVDTAIYCENLKYTKKNNYSTNPNERQILDKAKFVVETYESVLKHNPAEVNIDYKKFFFDRDEDEIKKFLQATMDIEEFDNTKLNIVSDMIKSYTKVNIELLKDVTLSPEFRDVLRNIS